MPEDSNPSDIARNRNDFADMHGSRREDWPGQNMSESTAYGMTRSLLSSTPDAAKVSRWHSLGTHNSSTALQRSAQPSGVRSVPNAARPTRHRPYKSRFQLRARRIDRERFPR